MQHNRHILYNSFYNDKIFHFNPSVVHYFSYFIGPAWIQKIPSREGVLIRPFIHQRISQRPVWSSLKKELDQRGQIAYRGGSVPDFLKKIIHVATCNFPGGGGSRPPVPPPLDPHVVGIMQKLLFNICVCVFYLFVDLNFSIFCYRGRFFSDHEQDYPNNVAWP